LERARRSGRPRRIGARLRAGENLTELGIDKAIENLPAPFNEEHFRCLREDIYDCSETRVYINEAEDFAFLFPRPEVKYVEYRPRVEALDLTTYKKALPVVERRYEKVASHLEGVRSLLEVGAANGALLAYVRSHHPEMKLASIEVDENTRAGRDAISDLAQYTSFDQPEAEGRRFDAICMFHVLEHIFEPTELLERCRGCLEPGGRLIIEVPSLDDPIRSLYHSEPYEQFYFQRQHPYVYSARSLSRLITRLGLSLDALIHHQRYGLENHLQWLSAGTPGGNETFRQVFGTDAGSYTECIERSERTDAVIAIASDPR
jgi:SAM-dependent methyltransferase